MPLYDYRCASGHVFEKRGGYDEAACVCACGEQAARLGVYLPALKGETVVKYQVGLVQEAAAEADYYHRRIEEDRGVTLPRRNLAKEAVAKAKSMGVSVR